MSDKHDHREGKQPKEVSGGKVEGLNDRGEVRGRLVVPFTQDGEEPEGHRETGGHQQTTWRRIPH